MGVLRSLGLVLGLALTSFSAQAAPVGAIWDTGTSGTLNGVSFTVSGFESPGRTIFNLAGPNFSAAPLSTEQVVATYRGRSEFTVTFDSAVADLLLYALFWRSNFSVDDSIYDFSQEFELQSGLGDATIDPDTINLMNTGFGSGIIRFTSPVTSLSVTTNVTSGSFQILTFGLAETSVAPIPLPATGLLLIGGLAALTQLRRLSRRG